MFSSSQLFSLRQAAPHLSSHCFPRYFSFTQENTAIEHTDILLLFSEGRMQFFSETHQLYRGKASKSDIHTVLQWRVTICLPLSSSSSKEGKKKFHRSLALHYLLALTFMRFPAGIFLLSRQDEHPQKLAERWLLTCFQKLTLFQIDSVSLVSNFGFAFSRKIEKARSYPSGCLEY